MKRFDSLQKLWSYCLFCPLCKDVTRNISLISRFGCEIFNYAKKGQILEVDCEAGVGLQRYHMLYAIDCVRNDFLLKRAKAIRNKDNAIENIGLSFNIIADCGECFNSSITSKIIDLNLPSKQVHNFSVDMESIYLLEGKHKYHLTLNYANSSMLISKCFQEEDGGIIDDNKVLKLPLVNFDLSNPKKVVNKIRTLIVFS